MVVLRLKRFGRTHRPFYRICVMDKRAAVKGRAIEEIGWYDPIAPAEKQFSVNVERAEHWLSVGAQPSQTARTLIKRAGGDPTSGKKLEKAEAQG